MIWWEREIYVKLLVDYQEQKKQQNESYSSNLQGFN